MDIETLNEINDIDNIVALDIEIIREPSYVGPEIR
jgi:hypothetical protein